MTAELQIEQELAHRYTLLKKLGSGAETETWLASDRMTRASVALKVLRDEARGGEALQAEWQTSIRLLHAHIVRVFEFHEEPPLYFYSMQYVEGGDIGVLTGAPLAHVLGPAALLADALRYAHARGVVHRDIKASNVLLDRNGAPYLSDFGVASSIASSGGSLIAASPQSLAGEAPQPADDIFALGGLLYELISGRSPYSSAATAEDIRGRVPAPLQQADGSDVPAPVETLLQRMLDKDAARRPDAAGVIDALQAAGFAAATAPARYIDVDRGRGDELIEASADIVKRRRAASSPAAGAGTDRGGLKPRTVFAALAVLLVILVGVVFLLPATIPGDGDAGTAAAPDAAPPEAVPPATPPAAGQAVERDERVVARAETETVLGELLSKMDTLEKRAVQRWGGLRFRQAQALYAEGDSAYLARDYATAIDRYRETIELIDPMLEEVDRVFRTTLEDGQAALDRGDAIEALPLFELAVAISPGHAGAAAGYERARNLDTVLALTDQGFSFEKDLELEAARQSFARAAEIDPAWQPAVQGLERVLAAINQRQFDQRMTEGLTALADGHHEAARAAFRMAKTLQPESPEPADGLLQVELAIRLERIAAFESQAAREAAAEQWDAAVQTYQKILDIDADLAFAQDGLARASRMQALHEQLEAYIAEPNALSAPATMQRATRLVVDITRMPEIGPRLGGQRDELSRLLKRAATPLKVQLVSDNATEVSIYKVGRLGSFETRELELRPGSYVAVGSRPGFRDVRLEFEVGPEVEPGPIVVRCEEAI